LVALDHSASLLFPPILLGFAYKNFCCALEANGTVLN
jgi:hypothetical protein